MQFSPAAAASRLRTQELPNMSIILQQQQEYIQQTHPAVPVNSNSQQKEKIQFD